MFGRGTYDMKAGLAACMLALADGASGRTGGRRSPRCGRRRGTREPGHTGRAQAHPGRRRHRHGAHESQVCIAHKGFSWHEITTLGRSAHGSQPQFGIDAVTHMGRVLNRLEALQADLRERPPHPLLGHGSLHAYTVPHQRVTAKRRSRVRDSDLPQPDEPGAFYVHAWICGSSRE